MTLPIAGQFEHWDVDMRGANPRGLVIVSSVGAIATANRAAHELLACKTEDDLRALLGPLLTQLNSLAQAPDTPHRFELHAPGSAQGPGIVGFAQRLNDGEFRWLLMLQPAVASPSADGMMQHALRNQLLQRLYGTMRHDLNSPIQAALWTFDLLERALQRSQLTAEQRAQFEESTALGRKELARLKSAVQRFLSFAAPDAGEPERLDVRDLLEDVLQLIAAEASLTEVHVTLESPPRAAVVEVVRAPLEQALATLMFAVVDSTARGGTVTTAISEADGGVEVEIVTSSGPQAAFPAPRAGDRQGAQTERSLSSNVLDAARAIARANGGDVDERLVRHGRAFRLRWPRTHLTGARL